MRREKIFMRVIQLRLSTIEDLENFVDAAAGYAVNIDLLKPVDLMVYAEDEEIMDDVINDVKNWIVSESESDLSDLSDLEEVCEMKVGDKVKILSSAEKYVTGETIPARLKGETDEVMQMGKDGKSVLLKKIYSWVWLKDVEIVK